MPSESQTLTTKLIAHLRNCIRSTFRNCVPRHEKINNSLGLWFTLRYGGSEVFSHCKCTLKSFRKLITKRSFRTSTQCYPNLYSFKYVVWSAILCVFVKTFCMSHFWFTPTLICEVNFQKPENFYLNFTLDVLSQQQTTEHKNVFHRMSFQWLLERIKLELSKSIQSKWSKPSGMKNVIRIVLVRTIDYYCSKYHVWNSKYSDGCNGSQMLRYYWE